MEKEESVGQGEKKIGTLGAIKSSGWGKRRNREGGRLEPLSQGTARVGEAEPAACESGRRSSAEAAGRAGRMEAERRRAPAPPQRCARPRPRRAAPEQRLVPAGSALPQPPVPSPITHRDGTSRARRV